MAPSGRLAALLAAAGLALLAGCAVAPQSLQRVPGLQALQAPQPEAASGYTAKPGWIGRHQIIATANPIASRAGFEILQHGGSAVDALIAAQMVLNLVEPQSSGIGGGLFLVHFDGHEVQTYDGRETAPAAATPDLFMQDGRPMDFIAGVVGGRSVGVPGALRALELAHRRDGRLPWASLFEPAIRLAEEGFAISPRLAGLLREPSAASLRLDPEARAYFFDAAGQPKAAGQRLRNPALAAVLRDIAARGADAFYRGPLAREIVERVRGHPTNPGLLSVADLAGYRAFARAPLCFDYELWRLCGMAPPSSGPLAIGQMLGMLAHRDLRAVPPVPSPLGLEPSVEAVHLISEAGRLAFADRARFVGDPDYVSLPGGSPAALLAPAYLKERAALIGARSMGRAEPGRPLADLAAWADDRSPDLPSTSQLAVADSYGNVASMTTTIEHAFGSQIMVHGFLLNNELTDFSFVPSEQGRPVANRVEPGKRPRSTMSPMLVFERAGGPGRVVEAIGSAGGPSIVNYVIKVLIGTLDWGLDVQQAIALPNFGSRNGPTELERGRVTRALVEGLEAKGHVVRLTEQTSGLQGLQRIERDGQTVWLGGADPRREGIAIGD